MQKRLDELRLPPYIQRLVVDSLDLGTVVPLIRSIRAVAGMVSGGRIKRVASRETATMLLQHQGRPIRGQRELRAGKMP